jgi:hypothetical protein
MRRVLRELNGFFLALEFIRTHATQVSGVCKIFFLHLSPSFYIEKTTPYLVFAAEARFGSPLLR